MARVEAPWMQELMVCCDELHGEELLKHRSSGLSSLGVIDLIQDPPGPLVPTHEPAPPSKGTEMVAAGQELQLGTNSSSSAEGTHVQALQWATGVKNEGVLSSIAAALPPGVLQEQIRKFSESKSESNSQIVAVPTEKKLTLHMNLSSGEAVARAFDAHLQVLGVKGALRLPRNCIKNFIRDTCIVPKTNQHPSKWVRRQYDIWAKKGRPKQTKSKYVKASLRKVPLDRRRRSCGTQGRPRAMPLVRQEMYDWYIMMRYAIDWREHDRQMRAQGKKKCVGRFPIALLKLKFYQLVGDYCVNSLIAGQQPRIPEFRWRWYVSWMDEFGLSLLKANRRYKVAKRVLEERLELWWITLHRLRALAVKCLGYDLEMENFDQSPFHNNETGAQNKSILGLSGSPSVPLIEGRQDVLERWTGQFTTWSNADRIMAEGPPYCELMFKGSPDGPLVLQLREACRNCGFGPWLTIATQWKGSYREADILSFFGNAPAAENRRQTLEDHDGR